MTMILTLSSGFAAPLMSNPDSSPPAISPQEIIDRAVARSEAQYSSGIEANFESFAVAKTQSLDGNHNPTQTETARYHQYPLDGAIFEELIEIDGRPLTPKELEKEEEKKKDFLKEIEKRKIRGEAVQPSKEEAIRFDKAFTERYLYKWENDEVIRNHPCWVISFTPKQGKLPARNRMDHALNQTTGLIWISQDDYGLVRVEFALRKPYKYWGGFLAVVRNTDGTVDYTRVEPNVWLPLHFDLTLDLKVMLVKNIRRLIIKDWFDYKRAYPPVGPDRKSLVD